MTELVGKALLNGINIFVENEDANFDVDIPTHKVEKGIDLSDHVERQPVVVKLSGKLVRPTPEQVESLIQKLLKIENEGKTVTYEGRRIYQNMLMSGLNIKANSKIMNGYNFSCTLTEVRIAQSSYVPPEVKAVIAKTAEAGRKQTENKKSINVSTHTVKKGDTYSSLSKKYGVSVATLQKLNGYDSRKIPIGVKLKLG
ncbi:LysM peptidoglycan-binding domain-containing protein [Lysinibacillus antri]|uniref:LysM peptidoglycan-binding domain-containing protein n=1 Tax=Lysinibacillus antri TaxID=2498145 RepID=A0A3S0P887_9BACI|nr:LysM peptidoglycan-binding domain-containing protein [Lysinibacillus antri]RUL56459.1 LysM peptidoglycan-binding domain-containing protein [Lysinibacillus antri]